MKIGITVNTSKDIDFSFTKEVCSYIDGKASITLEDDIQIDGYPKADLSTLFKVCDFIFIIGGDGTILNKIKNTSFFCAKIYGINIGNLGYLTDVDRHDYKSGIDKILKSQYTEEKRMMIYCEANNKQYIALNDICISKGIVTNMIELHIEINDSYVDTLRGDGLIVATPTGSTAYNLSVGGPILKSDCNMICVTPVSPHAIFARPFVISGDDTINIISKAKYENQVLLNIDGTTISPLNGEHVIRIRRSMEYVTIVKTSEKNFYRVLRDKIQK